MSTRQPGGLRPGDAGPPPIDRRLLLDIHTRLTELRGSDEADAFMAQMLPVHWHDVATKDDLRVFSAELRAELCADIVR